MSWDYFFSLKDPIRTFSMIDWGVFLMVFGALVVGVVIFNIYYRRW